MELTLFERGRKKSMMRETVIVLFAIALLYAAVLTPIYHVINSDIMLRTGAFPIVLDMLMQILNYLFYWFSFAILLYAVYRLDLANGAVFFGIYAGAVVFRYLAALIATFLTNGFPPLKEFLSEYLPYFLLDIALDLLLAAIFLWIFSTVRRDRMTKQMQKRGAMLLSSLPALKLFDFKNPVLLSAFWGALIPAAAQLLSRVRFDIFYGAPQSLIDLLWMAIYYLSDLAAFLIGFLVMVLFLNHFYFSEEKARIEYEAPVSNHSL